MAVDAPSVIADWTAVAVALAVPIAVLVVQTARRPPRRDCLVATFAVAGLAPVLALPLLAWLGARTVSTVDPAPIGRVGPVPIAALAVVAASALLVGLLVWRIGRVEARPAVARTDRAWGTVAGLAIAAVGVAVAVRVDPALGATLVWAGPLLGVQWAVDWRIVWARRRSVAWAVVVPTLYFWSIDVVAFTGGAPVGGWGPSLVGAILAPVGSLLVVQMLVVHDRHA
ncbi:hypothetical protein [Halococcoides cellulosivorans]|uniref:Lycopene cyclase domain-containing protein n=1 Tax=Halococcoides cellulosivorans TaxID=1679096 RepID=A0A2R4X031_9EURY|nr:hypothetical protein [Halococcoides cellulosivorans]AWB27150.1 hypothetical protein HARCEL1_05240 [Halococcoides cellulosivorans]